MSEVFFTSDTHFGHANIVKYCGRPFSNVEEMDRQMIETWNGVVGPHDTVWHLGDFCFHKEPLTYTSQLNGNIRLILGNHDYRISKSRLNAAFFSVDDYKEIVIGSTKVIMCHYPFYSWNRMTHGTWNLHGHSHGTSGVMHNRVDVGVDANRFRPVSVDELNDLIVTSRERCKCVHCTERKKTNEEIEAIKRDDREHDEG